MEKRGKYLFWALFALLLVGLYLYGIHYLPLRGEEANRILTAYEMVHFGDWFNLTHLGEPYYAKPPLFMWLVALFSSLFGWDQESARLISVLSSFATALLVYIFALRLFGERKIALLAAFILLTLGDLPLFYGFLAEIDAFHMFIYFLSAVGVFLLLRRGEELLAFLFAGFTTALVFLTKGMPAFYHVPLTVLIFLFYFNRWRSLLSLKPLAGIASMLLPLGFWFIHLKNPKAYLIHLWFESFHRTPMGEGHIKRVLLHLVTYPLLNFRQMLPHSLYTFLNLKRFKGLLSSPLRKEILLLLALIGLNYLPYLISPGARGRYIMVVFPFVAVLLAVLLKEFLPREVSRFKVPLWVLLFLLFTLGVGFALYHRGFFDFYGWFPLVVFGAVLITALVLLPKFNPSWAVFTLLLLAVFKWGYIDYFAPWREAHHPERRIAYELSKAFPRGAVIRYLPQRVNMELCAYTDLFTRGIVLRNKGSYFLTTERELPKGVDYKILATYGGWVAGVFLKGEK